MTKENQSHELRSRKKSSSPDNRESGFPALDSPVKLSNVYWTKLHTYSESNEKERKQRTVLLTTPIKYIRKLFGCMKVGHRLNLYVGKEREREREKKKERPKECKRARLNYIWRVTCMPSHKLTPLRSFCFTREKVSSSFYTSLPFSRDLVADLIWKEQLVAFLTGSRSAKFEIKSGANQWNWLARFQTEKFTLYTCSWKETAFENKLYSIYIYIYISGLDRLCIFTW